MASMEHVAPVWDISEQKEEKKQPSACHWCKHFRVEPVTSTSGYDSMGFLPVCSLGIFDIDNSKLDWNSFAESTKTIREALKHGDNCRFFEKE